MPAASIAVKAFWRRTLVRLFAVRNESVAAARMRHSTSSAAKIA